MLKKKNESHFLMIGDDSQKRSFYFYFIIIIIYNFKSYFIFFAGVRWDCVFLLLCHYLCFCVPWSQIFN